MKAVRIAGLTFATFARATISLFVFCCELIALYIATFALWNGEYIEGAIVTASAALFHFTGLVAAAHGVALSEKLTKTAAEYEQNKR